MKIRLFMGIEKLFSELNEEEMVTRDLLVKKRIFLLKTFMLTNENPQKTCWKSSILWFSDYIREFSLGFSKNTRKTIRILIFFFKKPQVFSVLKTLVLIKINLNSLINLPDGINKQKTHELYQFNQESINEKVLTI